MDTLEVEAVPASAAPPPRKRLRLALVGVALAVLPLVALALNSYSGREPASTVSHQQTVAAALAATNSLTTYTVDQSQLFDDGVYVAMSGLIAGDDSRLLLDFNGSTSNNIKVDRRSFRESDDGTWRETVVPAREWHGDVDPVAEIWLSLQEFDVVGGDRGAGTFELACPRDPGTLDAEWQWICDGPVPSQLKITLDPSGEFVAELHVVGEIPTYPGVREHGSLKVQLAVSDEPLVVELPDRIDVSGIDCLAESLGADGATTQELGRLIDNHTTRENKRLFEDCGYTSYPAGVDLDLVDAPG